MRRWFGLASATALAMLLVACGGGATPADTGGAVDPNGTLRVSFSLAPTPLDPHTPASEVGQTAYLSLLYDRLTQMTNGANGVELAPMVATRWEFSPDGTQLTFTLRDDVTFSDGSKLDASAVKQSLERALTLPKSTAKNFLSAIGKVDAPNPTTVVITTTRPAADLPYQLSTGFGSIVNPKALGNPDLDVNPQGSGPYVLTSLKQGDSATLERRTGYWDPEAGKAKTIVIRGIPDANSRLSDLRSGGSDMAFTQSAQFKEASALGNGFRVVTYPSIASRQSVSINQFRPYLSDVRVRQAINFALDRQAIVDALLDGHATPLGQPLGAKEPGHLDTPPVVYGYDPAKAKQLLQEAGVPDGYALTMVSQNLSPQQDIAKVVQAQLGAIGLKVDIEYLDPLQAISAYTKDSKYDLSQTITIGYETPRLTLANTYLSTRTLANPPPPELVDALGRAADPRLSDADRTAQLERADGVITAQAMSVFIAGESTTFLTTDKVVGADDQARSNYQGVYDLRHVGVTR